MTFTAFKNYHTAMDAATRDFFAKQMDCAQKVEFQNPLPGAQQALQEMQGNVQNYASQVWTNTQSFVQEQVAEASTAMEQNGFGQMQDWLKSMTTGKMGT